MAEPTDRLIRYRATSIVARNGKVLLLREPQDTEFHLPGGGIESGELPVSAAARELCEETGLEASELEYLFDYCELWELTVDTMGRSTMCSARKRMARSC